MEYADNIKEGEMQMGKLTSLPNIGPKLESQLQEAGIETISDLRSVGSREAWLRILSRILRPV